MLKLFGFAQIFHCVLDLGLLKLEGLVSRIDLNFEIFDVFNELEDLLILALDVLVRFV